MGEALAVELLVKHRVTVISRNVQIGPGEIDVLALIDGTRSVVEVRSIRQGSQPVDPLMAFDPEKARRVHALAGRLRAGRVDLITASFSPVGVDLHWLPWAG